MRRLITVAGLLLAVLLGTAGPALAHNVLVGSTPAEGAQVAAGPKQVTLTFDQPVQEGYNTVNVIGPNGDYWTESQPSVRGTSVSTPVRELGPAGTYTVGYRVLSNDGHPVTGKVTFTLTQPGNGTPAPPPQDAADQGSEADAGMPIWPWVAGAAVLVVLGGVLALRLGGPKD